MYFCVAVSTVCLHRGDKTYLCLDRVELRDAVTVDPLELLVPERGHWQRLQVEQLRRWNVLLRQDEVPERICENRR